MKERSPRVQPLILGIVGEKGSGKSTLFEYLRRRRGVFSARTSDVLADILKRLSLNPENRLNHARLAEALRSTFGPDILPRVVLADPRARRSRVVAIEGMRRLRELRPLFRRKNFKLLYITAPIELRWRRAQQRRRNKRSDDHVTLAAYRRIERTLITEREIPKMAGLADVRIDNVGTMRELYAKVGAALRRFGLRP